MATTITYLVDTDTNNLDANFYSLSSAVQYVVANHPDITTETGTDEIVEIVCQSSDGVSDTTSVAISTVITSITNYIIIRSADTDRAGIEFDSAKYRLNASGNIITVADGVRVIIDGLQIIRPTMNSSAILTSGKINTCVVSCYIDCSQQAYGNAVRFPYTSSQTDSPVYIVNNFIKMNETSSNQVAVYVSLNQTSSTYTIANNTMDVFGNTGIQSDYIPWSIKNNIVIVTTGSCTNISNSSNSQYNIGVGGSFAGSDNKNNINTEDLFVSGTYIPKGDSVAVGIGPSFPEYVLKDLMNADRPDSETAVWDAGALKSAFGILYLLVDTDTNNEDADFYNLNSATQWIATAYPSLILADKSFVVTCQASTGLKDSVVVGGAFAGDATRFITVRASDGHRAGSFYDETKYRVESTASPYNVFHIYSEYSVIDGIQVKTNGNTAMQAYQRTGVVFKNVFAWNTSGLYGLQVAGYQTAENCIARADVGTAYRLSAHNSYFRNCTAVDSSYGFGSVGIICSLWNCLAIGNTVDFGGVNTSMHVYSSISSDGSIVNYVDDGCLINQTVNFVEGTYQPVGGAPADGSGLDLSEYFTTDITGATRTIPWDIGAVIAATSGSGVNYEIACLLSGGGGQELSIRLAILRSLLEVSGGGDQSFLCRLGVYEYLLDILGGGEIRKVFSVGLVAAMASLCGGNATISSKIGFGIVLDSYGGGVITIIPRISLNTDTKADGGGTNSLSAAIHFESSEDLSGGGGAIAAMAVGLAQAMESSAGGSVSIETVLGFIEAIAASCGGDITLIIDGTPANIRRVVSLLGDRRLNLHLIGGRRLVVKIKGILGEI